MDWAEEEETPSMRAGAGPGAGERWSSSADGWRDGRLEGRSSRRGMDDRWESLRTRGRDLVDGLSGSRPGSRPAARGGDRGGGGRSGLEGLGRWVEGRLDWLLDDRDDWRESWEEAAERPPSRRQEDNPPAASRGRAPLEAISRRGGRVPIRPTAASPGPSTAPSREGSQRSQGDRNARETAADNQDWPEADAFRVARWRREAPPPRQGADPLAEPPGPPSPGRPLPRSTRRR